MRPLRGNFSCGVCTLLVLGSLWLDAATAQNIEGTPQYNVRVNIVSLDVEVLDKAGNPVLELTRSDFRVKEDGKIMTVTNFSRLQDRPVSLAIVLDTSGIPLVKLNAAKQFIFQVIHLLGRDDDICLYTFDARDAYLEQHFTVDRGPIVRALENISVPSNASGGGIGELFRPSPLTGLGIDLALRSLEETGNGRKALLLISNRFRGLGPGTVDHIQSSACTLLTLGFGNAASMLVSLGGDAISKRQLMRESGGRKFTADTEDISGISRAIAYSLKNYYALSYVTDMRGEKGKVRHIEVQIPGRDYRINARRSYIPGEKSEDK